MDVQDSKIQTLTHDLIKQTIDEIYDGQLHAKRVLSLSNATQGAITNASLAIHAIGHGLSVAQGTTSKHAIKQVDRLLSNEKIVINDFFISWVRYQTQKLDEVVVAMDWTDFAKDDQSCFSIQLITKNGRSLPLLWKTVRKSDLKNKQRMHEIELLTLLRNSLDKEIKITIIGDRGFASIDLLEALESLKYTYIIRFVGKTYVEDSQGISKTARKWLSANGRAKTLKHAKLTERKHVVNIVVCYQEAGMKDGWFIASNDPEATTKKLTRYYAKRWSIECSFRDIKDDRFGFGLENVRTRACDRRDRLLLIAALTIALLTLLGVAGESIGFDRHLKANTVKHRTLSLLRQGMLWYQSVPNMPDKRLCPLLEAFNNILKQDSIFQVLFFK